MRWSERSFAQLLKNKVIILLSSRGPGFDSISPAIRSKMERASLPLTSLIRDTDTFLSLWVVRSVRRFTFKVFLFKPLNWL